MRKKMAIFSLWMLLLLSLAACAAPPPTPKADNAAGTAIVATFMAQITQTAAAAATSTPTASAAGQEETEEPDLFDQLETSEAPDDFSTATPGPYQVLLSRFRFVTVTDGNLYVRDGMGLPKQITSSGSDHAPVISDDGQKIVFYRGEKFDHVFVVNADGSGAKELISQKIFSTANTREVLSPSFRPGTHHLIFHSDSCDAQKCQADIFLADTESLAVTKIVNSLPVQRNLDDIFTASPDGQFLVVKNSDQLDLYGMDGKILQANIVSGAADNGYWLPDSSGLIVVSTLDGDFRIWRYTVKDRHIEKISLDPMPALRENISCISPDRNWILYQDHEQKNHLGNLETGQTQVSAWDGSCSVNWSVDSKHFASATEIGSVDGTPPTKLADGHFIAWLDATHYLFSKGKSILDLQTYIAEVGKEADAVQVDFLWSPVYAVLEPTPVP